MRETGLPARTPAAFRRLISPDELSSWILYEDDSVIVVDKPGDVVCHPSKAGPWSSLAGAVREYAGLKASHLIFRLDRETSVVVVFAKSADAARRLQEAVRLRRTDKYYLALMTGELSEPVTVEQPLGNDPESPVLAKCAVVPGGRSAVTRFTPLAAGGGFTLAGVVIATGRKHQIRAHAQWLGKHLVGDKIYGPGERFFLEFIERGWTKALAEKLLMPRQALHCHSVAFRGAGMDRVFRSPMPADMSGFCEDFGISVPDRFRADG